MKSDGMNTRRCGVLLHPTSFPSPFGIGDFGIEARKTLLMLSRAGVSLWQILPLGPTGYGDSPYAARSTFAGNELLIDLRSLDQFFGKVGMGKVFQDEENRCTGRVNYNWVYDNKMPLLKEAAKLFIESKCPKTDYMDFCRENSWWLDDYALYQALVNYHNDSRWFMWEPELKTRKKAALSRWTKQLAPEIEVYKTLQYFFFMQWNSLHRFANELGIQIIGDIPIYVAGDSVDAWTDPRLFKIDADGNQTAQAGCPPDAFTEDGQLWGNPVYNWDEHRKDDFAWWRRRMEMTMKLVDIVRIDHFRGFESYWEVPAGAHTARTGKWMQGPGMDLLRHFKGMNVIGEDLGFLTPAVLAMKKKSGFPGMKITQFAWDFSKGYFDTKNAYLPHNFEQNCVAYAGTHDNETTRGWFGNLDERTQDIVRRYYQSPNEDIVWQMIRGNLASAANTVVVTMQDILGLDNSARMNLPASVGNANWSWRYDPSLMQDWMMDRLGEYINIYGRNPKEGETAKL